MIKIDFSHLEFISKATIDVSHAMGRMAKIGPSIAIIGSNRITPDSKHKKYYDLALEIAEVIGREGWNIIAGGGTGVNEAATIGAGLGKAKTVAIRLISSEFKMSKRPDIRVKITNPFNRKVLFDLFSEAYIFFPGGFGTLDALFEALTLQQTRRIDQKPIICVGEDFWKPLLEGLFKTCLKKEYQTIDPKDQKLLHVTDNYREIVQIIYQHRGKILKTKGVRGLPGAKSGSSRRAQGFAHKVATELIQAFNTFHGVGDGITVFGSSRSKPKSKIYSEALSLAQDLGKIFLKRRQKSHLRGAIITGGGPGNMEAANKGARLSGAPSLGLGIDLPTEQGFNPFVDHNLCYEFKYFFCRKWLFSALTDVFIATPGGFGTYDELFEMITLKQLSLTTKGKLSAKSIYCVNKDFWNEPLTSVIDILSSHGFMGKNHNDLVHYNLDLDEAISKIKKSF